ncbi:uncharacterized [Tachysurus ichikawai]
MKTRKKKQQPAVNPHEHVRSTENHSMIHHPGADDSDGDFTRSLQKSRKNNDAFLRVYCRLQQLNDGESTALKIN